MKKSTALLLFLGMVLLSSCGKPEEPASETTSGPTTEPMPLHASIIGEDVSYKLFELNEAADKVLTIEIFRLL